MSNLMLFQERFPALALLAPSWECKAVVEETLPELSIDKAELLYIYGLGTGSSYFQVKEWLKKDRQRRLIFIEQEEGVIASWLQRKETAEILSDPQVHLAFNETIDALADRFPMKRVEVIALPSHKGRRFQTLRLKILRKTTLSHALHLDRLHGYQPFQNFVQNLRHLPYSFYANGLKGSFQNVPAIVCGAGPSLQQSMPILRTLENKALLIAGGSTLAALSSQGVMPHFGMAIDPNLEEYRRLRNSFAFHVPLLYSTRVFPA
ncbi:MAG TPA: 6-hydroxymethylpterin diphosphokinase MptE-like protein, partial [Chlamydiales bacterium]|nr:6-hydroxymethylpterin diphosphokinase MptE-like protein [Chlamydiales bacterium]